MDEALRQELIDYLRAANCSAADRHYSQYIFKPRFKGDTLYQKYEEEHAEAETDLIARLENL